MLWPSQYECGPRLCRCRPWIEMPPGTWSCRLVRVFIHSLWCLQRCLYAVDHELRLFGTYFHTKCTSAVDLLERSSSCPLLPPIRSMSSANRTCKLEIGLPPMEIVGTWSWRLICIVLSRKRLNNTGERIQPCRTPMVARKKMPIRSCYRKNNL